MKFGVINALLFIHFFVWSNKVFSQEKSLLKYQSVFEHELKEWTNSFKNFNLSSFIVADTLDFHEATAIDTRDSDWKSYMDIYQPMLSFSPNKEKFIDIYSYDLNLEKRNDSLFSFIAGETQIYLYNLKNSTETKLFFLGFSAQAKEVAWVDNDKFLITVARNLGDGTFNATPEIYLGNCRERKLYGFISSDTTCVQTQGYGSPKMNGIKIYDAD